MQKVVSIALGLSLTFGSLSLYAQTLFSYGPNKVSKEEFLQVYEKNNAQKQPDYSEKSISEYLNLYSLFKMKVQEALDTKRDTLSSLKNELSTYKAQLARSYLMDKEVTESLNKEAYERMKYDIDISHILILVKPGGDTLAAKKQIDSLYQVIQEGKVDFETIAKQFSEDKGTSENGGKIGYISALQIIYPIETVAYNTEPGKVSQPFLTQFGYHILKVNDKRESKGQVEVAQILLTTPKSKGEEGERSAISKAKSIQNELDNGQTFESLVEKYSEDNFTNKRKGLLEPFGVGRMTPEFENAAFALKNPGDVSKPVKTEYGYHILQLVKKFPIDSYENMRPEIASKVEKDNRANHAKEAYEEGVRQQYNFKEFQEPVTEILSAFNHDTSSKVNFETYAHYNKPMFELNNKAYTQHDFLNYVELLTNGQLIGNKTRALTEIYKTYKAKTLQDLQEKELYANNKEYRDLIEEYKNGIMLFDLMDEKIWTKATQDTAGLEDFYVKNKAKYVWQPGFEGSLYTSPVKEDLVKMKEELAKGTSYRDAIAIVDNETNSARFNKQDGRFEYAAFPNLTTTNLKSGSYSEVFENEQGHYSLIYVNTVYDKASSKSLEEARGFVVADYQDYLENEWHKDLETKYPLKINEKVLKSIRK